MNTQQDDITDEAEESLSTDIDLGFPRLQMHRQHMPVGKLRTNEDKGTGWKAL